MSLTSKLLSASGGGITYVDDVFSAYTRIGTGADAVVTTGIDMTKGYLLWSKGRSGATDHALYDSVRGLTLDLASNSTAGQTTQTTGLKAVSTTGHTVGSLAKMNTNGATYVDWVSREAPKFFDAVTYTGTGVNRTVPHSLNCEVGTLIVKRTDTAADWQVYHRSAANTEYLVLNSTAAKATGTTRWNSTTPSTTSFSLGTDVTVNANGGTYVAYLYAHDTTADSIVKCGSFTSITGTMSVNLGWEPQYLLTKTVVGGQWRIVDISRGWSQSTTDAILKAHSSDAEDSSTNIGTPTAIGFDYTTGSGEDYIYIAIRRSNKPPTVGTEVYNAIARTGTGAAATVTGVGFAPDLVIAKSRNLNQAGGFWDRLRGIQNPLIPSATTSENAYPTDNLSEFNMNGISVQSDTGGLINLGSSGQTYINHFFKRAVGVFDEVCYTGDGTSNRNVPHNLGVAPELVIIKLRSGSTGDWLTTTNFTATTASELYLNTTQAQVSGAPQIYANTTLGGKPTASHLVFGAPYVVVNTSGYTYVAYLFTSKAGISKVFSYTGNGSSQTIDCGFTTGARFFLVKSTSVAGSWWVYDSVRGISAPADPALQLNSTAAEITTADAVDPHVSGVIVNQEATCSINANGVTYIGLAFA
jgi:hypothetical protein